MTVHMLIGVCRSDWEEGVGSPVVAGCVDEAIWEHCDQATIDEMWGAMKERLDPQDNYYEWREIVVSLEDVDVMRAFDIPQVPGTVRDA